MKKAVISILKSPFKAALIAVSCVIGLASVALAADTAPAVAAATSDITSSLDYWWGVAGKVVIVASGLSATIPAPAAGSPVSIVFKVLNWAALNVWNAKNAAVS